MPKKARVDSEAIALQTDFDEDKAAAFRGTFKGATDDWASIPLLHRTGFSARRAQRKYNKNWRKEHLAGFQGASLLVRHLAPEFAPVKAPDVLSELHGNKGELPYRRAIVGKLVDLDLEHGGSLVLADAQEIGANPDVTVSSTIFDDDPVTPVELGTSVLTGLYRLYATHDFAAWTTAAAIVPAQPFLERRQAAVARMQSDIRHLLY